MAKQQLRTVKKSSETGGLDRNAVRSAVINVRDGSGGRYEKHSQVNGASRTGNPGSEAACFKNGPKS